MPDIFAFDYRTVTFFGPPSQMVCLAIFSFCMVGRLSRSLAATWDIEFSFFSSGYLDVSVHPVCFFSLCVGLKIPLLVGCPIRRSVVWWIFAPTHSFSQLVTSFFASWCLGIRLMLFFSWPLFFQWIVFSFFCKIVLTLLLVFLELICSFHGSFCLSYLLGSDFQEIVDFC